MGSGQSTVTCNFSSTAASGDTCQSFATEWGLTLDGFEALNPGISCPGLTAGSSYCVLGTVASSTSTTTSGTPVTTTTVVTTPATTTTATTTNTASTSSPTLSFSYQPTQSGIATNCNNFYLVESRDTCPSIQSQYGISVSQFNALNPSVGARKYFGIIDYQASKVHGMLTSFSTLECDNLFRGYYVCVGTPCNC